MIEVIFAAIYGLNGGFCLLVFALAVVVMALVLSSGGVTVEPVDTSEDDA